MVTLVGRAGRGSPTEESQDRRADEARRFFLAPRAPNTPGLRGIRPGSPGFARALPLHRLKFSPRHDFRVFGLAAFHFLARPVERRQTSMSEKSRGTSLPHWTPNRTTRRSCAHAPPARPRRCCAHRKRGPFMPPRQSAMVCQLAPSNAQRSIPRQIEILTVLTSCGSPPFQPGPFQRFGFSAFLRFESASPLPSYLAHPTATRWRLSFDVAQCRTKVLSTCPPSRPRAASSDSPLSASAFQPARCPKTRDPGRSALASRSCSNASNPILATDFGHDSVE